MDLDAGAETETLLDQPLRPGSLFPPTLAHAGTLEHLPGVGPVGPGAPGRLPRKVRRALEYVRANVAGDIRLTDMAKAAGMSPFHFSRVFKNAIGLSPYRYLVRIRVEHAKALLCEGEQSLKGIAAELGFVDQSHMTNVFRRVTGTTPKAFQDTCRDRLAL